MTLTKAAVCITICGFALYNIVDDKTRAKFDNGFESQQIKIAETKNSLYLFAMELGGADEKELKAERESLDKEIGRRKEILAEKEKDLEEDRQPAEADEASKN